MAAKDPYKRAYTMLEMADAKIITLRAAKIAEMSFAIGSPDIAGYPTGTVIGNALTTNGDTDVYDFGDWNQTAPVMVRFVTTIGATPTVTNAIKGSLDGTTYTALRYADLTDLSTFSSSTFLTTTQTTKVKVIPENQRFRYLKVTLSATTNVTSTIDVFPFGDAGVDIT